MIEVLDARGLAVTDSKRERILGCKELETLTYGIVAPSLSLLLTHCSSDRRFDQLEMR